MTQCFKGNIKCTLPSNIGAGLIPPEDATRRMPHAGRFI